MGSAVVAAETHDDEVCEEGNACLTHSRFSHHLARRTQNSKDNRLIGEEVALFEGLCEIEFFTHLSLLDSLLFLSGVLCAIAHADKFFQGPFEMGYFHVLILLGRVGVLYV